MFAIRISPTPNIATNMTGRTPIRSLDHHVRNPRRKSHHSPWRSSLDNDLIQILALEAPHSGFPPSTAQHQHKCLSYCWS